MSSDKKGRPEPMADEYGYAGPWGDAKPGDVLPGFSTDPEQRKRDQEKAEQDELQRDLIGFQIAEISAQLEAARLSGDEARYKELREEQRRLTHLQLSIR
jgi:hypothetical protein